jgi:predicted PurR-regulated permease PerM
MTMSFRDKLLLWVVGITLLILFIYNISSILLPFIVAMIFSYILNPSADRLQKLGVSRALATSIIIGLFFTTLIAIIALLAPLIYNQAIDLTKKIPEYLQLANDRLLPTFNSYLNEIAPEAAEKAMASISEFSTYIFNFLGKMMANIWQSGIAVVNILSLLFVTPVVTFYVLRDWGKIIDKIDSLLPPKYAPTIQEQFKEINRTLEGYLRGQIHVCMLLGTYYAIGLSLAGLDFGFVIGMATGILSFIPYVGMLFGFALGVILAIFQFGDWFHVSIIVAVFLSGQFLEGNFITPKLVGDKVGLHPVWIIFGMLAGAAMFGFIGILLAVPITAIIGVLIRFGLKKYFNSSLFTNKRTAKAAKA